MVYVFRIINEAYQEWEKMKKKIDEYLEEFEDNFNRCINDLRKDIFES